MSKGANRITVQPSNDSVILQKQQEEISNSNFTGRNFLGISEVLDCSLIKSEPLGLCKQGHSHWCGRGEGGATAPQIISK